VVHDAHDAQPRDWHGRYAGSSQRGRESGPPQDAEEIHTEAGGVRVLLTAGPTPMYQIWKGDELTHEQPATRAWRSERKEMAAQAAALAGRKIETPQAVGRETFNENGVRVVVTEGDAPMFHVYKGDVLVHEQPATRAWKSEAAAVHNIASQAAGFAPLTATQQINGHIRGGSSVGTPVSVREQLDYQSLYVENTLAVNPSLNPSEVWAKGRELAAKWAGQGPAYFQRQVQLQESRQYQRHLEEEDIDRNKDIDEEGE
jgi:hypothetical protein